MKRYILATACMCLSSFAAGEEPVTSVTDAALSPTPTCSAMYGAGEMPASCDEAVVMEVMAMNEPGLYTFTGADESIESQLCIAAVTSTVEYDSLRKEHFPGIFNMDEHVQCNDMPISRFVRKYGMSLMTVSR